MYENCITLKLGDTIDFESQKKVKLKTLTETKKCDCNSCGKYFWSEISFKEHTDLKRQIYQEEVGLAS